MVGLQASPDDSGLVPIGAVLAERYRIVGVLGAGGMGRVYRGEHTAMGKPVAIAAERVGSALEYVQRTWFAVNAKFTSRGPSPKRPASKYPLSGIAKCGSCGGAIAAARVQAYGGPNVRVLCYGCAKHHERGSSVCDVKVHQPIAEVEAALVEHLQQHVLSEGVLQTVRAEIRSEIAAQLPKHEADTAALEAELATARAEQKRLAKAVAMADDVTELVSELKKRTALIQHLEAQILAAKRTPEDLAELVTKIETGARAKLADLRTALAEQRDLREVFLALFPEGLTFTPARTPDGERAVWGDPSRLRCDRNVARPAREE